MTERTTLPDGYYTVPPGKLANAVTWLEMRARPVAPLAPPLRLVPLTDGDEMRRLYAAVGTPWLWSRAAATARPPAPEAESFAALDDAGEPVGVVELTSHPGHEIEISYFGLVPEATGAGRGRRLMAAALDRAWASAARVWLHTCNFDHPAALRFYRACGFTPYACGFEIMDDPRLDGSLPAEAAPHVPLLPGRRD